MDCRFQADSESLPSVALCPSFLNSTEMLNPYIQHAIFDHYREHRSFGLYQAQFKDIKRLCEKGQFLFEATVVLETWEGPHRPPFGLETITLTNYLHMIGTSGSPIHILNYVHRDLSPTAPSRLPGRRNCQYSGESGVRKRLQNRFFVQVT
ncbi:DUF3888 domain-containing protein [Alicyclobacillus hesperidum]|uniref:DUF3888 domain-containing protein n=1 Tax=Alicyclobacillus hesperidum TaxID=89784 RepID=UPI0036F39433